MDFELQQAIEILSRTPTTLNSMLRDIPRPWLVQNEVRRRGVRTILWAISFMVRKLIGFHGRKLFSSTAKRELLSRLIVSRCLRSREASRSRNCSIPLQCSGKKVFTN